MTERQTTLHPSAADDDVGGAPSADGGDDFDSTSEIVRHEKSELKLRTPLSGATFSWRGFYRVFVKVALVVTVFRNIGMYNGDHDEAEPKKYQSR